MPIIDAQVHAYEPDHPQRPWAAVLHGPSSMTGDETVAAMDAANVDGAILVSPFAMYRYDASYALQVYAAHPTRFGLVKPIDHTDPAAGEVVTDWANTTGAVGARLMMNHDMPRDPADPGVTRVLQAAAQHDLPVNLLCAGRLDQLAKMAAQNANTRFVVDHLGLAQPFVPPVPADPWADLPALLALARYDNVTVKISGAGTLSHEPYPYPDIWTPIRRVLDAFGMERCMWGTDWTRATAFLTYPQGVDAFLTSPHLSDGDRAHLMGDTLSRVYRWSPSARR
ncbi:amidohydrolase [Acidisphaera sp. L21]|uniref:amidohydrolase family protein n=1 Tax=Acidisphaera sp. L21 TaxID=1641851 RepID=UPI00131D0578|nr:amidohydrolase family protein [Acidisphaera sp. L21]